MLKLIEHVAGILTLAFMLSLGIGLIVFCATVMGFL